MRTGRIEETTEANRSAAESAETPRAWGRMALVHTPRPADALAALARLLSGSTVAARSAVLAQASELVGRAMGADRVGLYLAPSLVDRGAPTSEMSTDRPTVLPPTPPDDVSADTPINASIDATTAASLAPIPVSSFGTPGGDRFLLAASWSRRGLRSQGSPIATRAAEPTAWHHRPILREIACVGPSGPLALIRLEGRGVDAVSTRDDAARCETVAGLIASFLERDRLERELVALRASRARGERLAQLGRVASSAAHDFNNVLTAILGYADLLELELELGSGDLAGVGGRGAEARGRPELEEIRLAAARGAALVEEVLGFSRERPSGETLVDLARSIERLEPMLRRVAGSRITLASSCEPGLAPVQLDGERFERVLVNLVANARHAIEAARNAGAERAGRITIALERAQGPRSPKPGGAALRLVVRDDGCGMSADVKRRVFEPFFTTRSALGGTGIGLADAADFARRAGGRIEIESREGEGTAIALVLPLALAPPPAA